MREYHEILPEPALAETVECCWISRQPAMHRVAPDGCADIVFRFREGQPELLAVGAMTRFADFAQGGANTTVGIRFRPGMWAKVVGAPPQEISDRIIPLEELWGARGRALLERMANERSAAGRAGLLWSMTGVAQRTPVQRAIAWMERRHGVVSLDQTAADAGLSGRQFRRVCLRETGLSPKLLGRILRFRHAQSRVGAWSGKHAGLAAECGFADQAHMSAEFKRFAGRTPSAILPLAL